MKNLRQVFKESISESKPKSKPVKEGKGDEVVTDKTFKEVEKILKSNKAEKIVYDAFGSDKTNAKLFLEYSLTEGIIGFLEMYRKEASGQTIYDLLDSIETHIYDSEAEIPFQFAEDWAEIPSGAPLEVSWDMYDKAAKASEGLYELLRNEFGLGRNRRKDY